MTKIWPEWGLRVTVTWVAASGGATAAVLRLSTRTWCVVLWRCVGAHIPAWIQWCMPHWHRDPIIRARALTRPTRPLAQLLSAARPTQVRVLGHTHAAGEAFAFGYAFVPRVRGAAVGGVYAF